MVFALRARRYRPRGRRRYGPSTREVYAAIDLGTNNCRLLIARPAPDGFRVIDAFSRIVRLGEGLAASGFLSEQAMARTLEALRVCSSKLDRRAVTRLRAVATEACRRAGNCRAFLERVVRETGLELEIISHKEEAELAAQGCAPLLDPQRPYAIIFDIGGGSTEISLLEAGACEKTAGRSQPQLKGFLSLPYGVVTLAERHGGRDVSRATYQAMVDEVSAVLMPFAVANDLGPALEVQMLGTSGTVTTLAGIHLGLKRYDRGRVDGVELETQILRSVSERLLQQDFTRRAEEPCIGPERADLVLPGCAILEAILRAWPVDRLRIADRGLREGILFNLMRRAGEPGVAHLPLPRWGSQAA